MSEHFRILPDEASEAAHGVDLLTAAWLGTAGFFTLLIAGLIGYFIVRYRFDRAANRETGAGVVLHAMIEIGWMIVPFAILFGFFLVGAKQFLAGRRPPADPLEVSVVAKQWMWKLAHESGRREIDSLHVPSGVPVRLRMTSEDVIHSFYVPAFRQKQDVLPGRYTSMWFLPTKPGKYDLFCAEYCGTSHSRMIGWVYVMPPEEYAAWATTDAEPPDQVGRRTLETLGCRQCHGGPVAGRAPNLEGLIGRAVTLADGRKIVADAEYVRRSILDPQADVVAGYKPVMPTFAGRIGPEQVDAIVAYLRTTSSENKTNDAP